MTHTLQVSLGDRSYPIYVGNGLAAEFAQTCGAHRLPQTLTVLTDTTVARLHLKPLIGHLRGAGFTAAPIVIPPGESQKSLRGAERVYTAMLRNGVGRSSAMIALGGGVVGDLAGFVAATYHRGIPVVHVPTTLLAQVDSSIGGKTAVNHPLGKNLIGAFHQPAFVWTDMAYLRTLPRRELLSGLGEVVKYGIIRDERFFAFLEEHLDRLLALDADSLVHVQAVCSSIKADIVSQDEREEGIRVILNFGHTIGHALEAAGGFRKLKHGEAVLYGMLAESELARRMGLLADQECARITSLIGRLPLNARTDRLPMREILSAMGKDKKRVGKKHRFVLPVRIGEVRVVEEVEESAVRACIGEGRKIRNC